MPLQAPFLFRLFGKKTIDVVVKPPKLGTSLRISSLYARMGISADQLQELGQENLHGLFLAHGFAMLRIVATAILNSFWLCWLNPVLAFWLKWKVGQKELLSLTYILVMLGGYENFPNTIRWAERMTVTKPNLSQPAKGS